MNTIPMEPDFELVYRLRISSGDGPDGKTHDADGLIAHMRADPEFRDWEKSGVEHHWQAGAREGSELWIRIFMQCARYLSDLIGGDIPILSPREVVEASVGIVRNHDDQAMLIGKSIARAVRSQVTGEVSNSNEALFSRIEQMIGGVGNTSAPPHSRWLNTEQVAERLGLHRATVERKFRDGQLDGDKTSGNQWRTTEKRLHNSPYLQKKKKKGSPFA